LSQLKFVMWTQEYLKIHLGNHYCSFWRCWFRPSYWRKRSELYRRKPDGSRGGNDTVDVRGIYWDYMVKCSRRCFSRMGLMKCLVMEMLTLRQDTET
jgi:hypothetical protein